MDQNRDPDTGRAKSKRKKSNNDKDSLEFDDVEEYFYPPVLADKNVR
jgi:hypothetical protein